MLVKTYAVQIPLKLHRMNHAELFRMLKHEILTFQTHHLQLISLSSEIFEQFALLVVSSFFDLQALQTFQQ